MPYRSSSSNSGSGLNVSTPVPLGATTDDIVYLFGSVDQQAASFTNWPTDFLELGEVDLTGDGQSVAVAWKRLSATDTGGYSMTLSGGSATPDWVFSAICLSGRNTSSTPTISAAATNNAANPSPVTVTANGVTATTGDDLVFMGALDLRASVAASFTPPTGYTEREDVRNGWAAQTIATKDNSAAGATGSVSATATLASGTAGWAAWVIRMPAASGSLTPSSTDTGIGTDTSSLSVTAAGTDLGIGADTSSLLGLASRSDSGAASESSVITPSGGVAGEWSLPHMVDTSGASVGFDTGTGTETSSLLVTVSSTDSGTGTGSSSLNNGSGVIAPWSSPVKVNTSNTSPTGSDSGTGTESTTLLKVTPFSGTDSATFAEGETLLVSTDSTPDGVGSESSKVTASTPRGDSGSSTESSAVIVLVSSSDSGAGAEASSIGGAGTPTGSLPLYLLTPSGWVLLTVERV